MCVPGALVAVGVSRPAVACHEPARFLLVSRLGGGWSTGASRPSCRRCAVRLPGQGAAQGHHKLVAGLQRVGQHGRQCARLAERGGDDESVVSTRVLPGGQQDAAAGGGIGAGLQAGDPILAEQGVVVAHHPGHRDSGAGQRHDSG